MSEISAVKEPLPDPKIGKSRPKSEISFPYYSLAKSIDVAQLIHTNAGGRCDRSQLAPLLGYSGVKNGGFLSRISAAKMFGLLEEFGDSIVLSERAKSIISSVRVSDAETAKVDAFLSVELYRRVFEQFNGQVLPGEAGLKNLLENQFKVVKKQVDPALRNMLESADAAGFFRVTGNRSKLVKPIISNDASGGQPLNEQKPANSSDTPPDDGQKHGDQSRHGSRHSGGGGDGRDIDPALIGLLRNLPPPGSKLGPKRRTALIEAFKSTINFIYPEEEESEL